MKKRKPLIIAAIAVVISGCVLAMALMRAPSLDSRARRDWKQKSLGEISGRVANPTWQTNELARLKSDGGYNDWLSDQMIVMTNGDWLAYANTCQKEEGHIPDLFLARGSDGRWYYSTFHFCVQMASLRMDEQPKDLAEFTNTYSLRTFDGQSDECLQKTWPPDKR